MADKQQKRTVGDYVTLQRGTTYQGSLVGAPGPALLGLGSIEPGGGFRHEQFKTYGGDCPPNLMLHPGDIYAALKGATKDGKMIGSVARVPPTISRGRLTQDTVKLVPRTRDPGEANFLYWVLRTPQYRSYCASHAMGSAVVALSRRDFLQFPVPPLDSERQQAVALLEALDRKIDVNRRLSATLEDMAQTLFRSWFVEFDPIRAVQCEGRTPTLPSALATQFPNSFAESELGAIPKGWTVSGLDKIARFINGLPLQRFPPKGGRSLPVIKIAQLRAGNTANTASASADIHPDHIAEDGDVLFSWSGSLECVLWTGDRGAVNQHLFKVTSEHYPKWFYYFWIHQHIAEFRRIAEAKATTMGHIQRHHLTEARVVLPPTGILEEASHYINPLTECIIQLALQSRSLTAIRNTVLPRLITGRIRAAEAGSILGD